MNRKSLAALILTVAFVAGFCLGHDRTATHVEVESKPLNFSDHWQPQSYTDCAEMSAAAIIGGLTGVTPNERTMIRLAASFNSLDGGPGYVPDEGTSMDIIPAIFQSFGLEAEFVSKMTVEALHTYLMAGYGIQVFINGGTVWRASGEAPWAKRGKHYDHAVTVAAVTANSVHLVDSATVSDEVVPLRDFVKAWRTSDSSAVLVHTP